MKQATTQQYARSGEVRRALRRPRCILSSLPAAPASPPSRQGSWTVAAEHHRLRLDRFLRTASGCSARSLERAARSGAVSLNGRVLTSPESRFVKEGDAVELRAPAAGAAQAAGDAPALLLGRVLFEDVSFLVLDKPAGLSSTPAPSQPASALSLAEALLLARDGAPLRLYPLHRLDKETSGVLVLAKAAALCAPMSRLLRTGGVAKRYIALLNGSLPAPPGSVWMDGHALSAGGRAIIRPWPGADAAVGARLKSARTAVEVAERFGAAATLVRLAPSTGRMHQLRAQAAARGCPVLGDDVYGRVGTAAGGRASAAAAATAASRLCLHCERMALEHPLEPGRLLEFVAPLPEAMEESARRLRLAAGATGAGGG